MFINNQTNLFRNHELFNLPRAGYPLGGALADEQAVTGAPHVLSARGGVPDGRSLIALAALHHVLDIQRSFIKLIKNDNSN